MPHAVVASLLLMLTAGPAPSRPEGRTIQAVQIPAQTELMLRFRQLVTSHSSRAGDPVIARVVRPVEVGGRTVVPLGSWVYGRVTRVRRVGLGLIRERAFVEVDLDRLALPNGEEHAVDLRVTRIDDARERVDENGRINGIRATASFASMVSGMTLSTGFIDPMLLGFTTASSFSAFRIPESEVIFPPGTEFRAELESPLSLSTAFDSIVPEYAAGGDERAALEQMVRGLPYRTATELTGAVSDVTNLLFIGSQASVGAAFDAAGWGQTDTLNARSSYLALRAIVENQGYREAPMSTLLLEGRRPVFTFAKTLNTFFERHHLRVFGDVGTFDGTTVLTSSSTHDSGIGFATNRKTFIHVIDEVIDEERDKVVHDLVLTGCVEAVTYVDRPWLPNELSNSTGDRLLTDKRIAVMRMNDCGTPQRVDVDLAAGLLEREEVVSARPGGVARGTRNVVLALKDGLWRGNIFYQAYSGIKMLGGALFGGNDDEQADGEPRSIDLGGELFLVVPGAEAHEQDVAPDEIHELPASYQHVAEPAHYDPKLIFSFAGTLTDFANDEFSGIVATLPIPIGDEVIDFPFVLLNEMHADRGFVARVTLRSGSHLSQEFSYTLNRILYSVRFIAPLVPEARVDGRMQMRQFNYNLLVHALPNGRRIRPYAAFGPGIQLIRLNESVQDPNGTLKVAFKEVSLIQSTWDFGTKPPLEGGGVFQLAFQYGGGVKVHLTPSLVLRADYRETISKQPDFFTKSYPSFEEQLGATPVGQAFSGALRHRLFSIGLGIGF